MTLAHGEALRRRKLLDATVAVCADVGYRRATVALVCRRAGVSRASFYRSFEDLDDCFIAVMDDAYERVSRLVRDAPASEDNWLDGLRAGLSALLGLFDAERAATRVWVVETLSAGPRALGRRERHLRELHAMIVARWPLPEGVHSSPLAAAGVLQAVFGIIHGELVSGREEPLLALLGPLMGVVLAPYLPPREIAREIAYSERLAERIVGERAERVEEEPEDAVMVPTVLADPRAYRARECLLFIASHAGASNRQIARGVGLAGAAQASALLARLHAAGMLDKRGGRPGHPNAWTLTAGGARVAGALHMSLDKRSHSPLPSAIPPRHGDSAIC
jgi:AcrR family transcriptional regulator